MQTPHCTRRLLTCVNSLVHGQATRFSKSLSVHITRKLSGFAIGVDPLVFCQAAGLAESPTTRITN